MQRRILRLAVAFAAAVSLATALAACGPGEPDEPTSLGIGVAPSFLSGQYNPVTAFGMDVTAVYETLMFYDYDATAYVPGLAESFELSDDRLTATFVLRDDVDFSDGEHLDAEVAAAVLAKLVQERIDAQAWAYEAYEVEFVATGEYVLEVRTAIRMLVLAGNALTEFGILPIFSPAYLDDFGALETAPVGTGPYVLDEIVPQVSASFTANEDYWDQDVRPYDNLEFVVFADQVAGLNALKSGQIDALEVSNSLAPDAEANGFQIHEGVVSTVGLWIADRGGSIQPALADLRVRQAIEYAFDRETINDSLNGGFGVITSQQFTKGTPEYVEGGDDRYGYDPEKARELMAEAGYEDGFDLTIPSTGFLGINTWEPIVTQYLGDIGIRVTYESFPDTGAYFTAALGGTFPVLMYPGSGAIAMDVYILPTAVFAFHDMYSDPTVDELAVTMNEGDLDESLEAISQIGEYALDQAWFTVFTAPNTLWATSPEVDIRGGFDRVSLFQPAE
jgi:peptide/nickel transport system substrate-binding protein